MVPVQAPCPGASDGRIWTHPVVVNGRLYLRDQEILYCYDVKGDSTR